MTALLSRIRAVSAAALEHGTLTPLETERVAMSGTATTPPFVVRLLLRHANKPRGPGAASGGQRREGGGEEQAAKGEMRNPFLPYDRTLFVCNVGCSHVVLLNKFPVVQGHTLLVTREFEPQSSLLTLADHRGVWWHMAQHECLAFYNAGRFAGASQPHKHVQFMPTGDVTSDAHAGAGAAERQDVPFHDALAPPGGGGGREGDTYAAALLPFLHGATAMGDVTLLAARGDVDAAAKLSMQRYTGLIVQLERRLIQVRAAHSHTGAGADGRDAAAGEAQVLDDVRPFPYNVIVSRTFMLVVPRRAESFRDVSVNALGFVGCLLVKSADAMRHVQQVGGMAVLKAVTFSNDTC